MITSENLVKDVIAKHPETQEVFAAHGLDMCCGGVHPVAMAAQAHGVDLERLVAELNARAAGGTGHGG